MLSASDEAMRRLLDYDRRRYWLANGSSIRFRITVIEVTPGRPHGIKYAFTLHGHLHRFRLTERLAPYEFRGADELICDFFEAVERACKEEGVPFEFEPGEVDVEVEDDQDDTQSSD